MRISVTGTPGCGKTTVSRLVAHALGFAYVDVGREARGRGCVVGSEGSSLVVDEKKIKKVLSGLDDCVFDWHLSETLDSDFVFVLRLPPRTLFRRLSARRYSKRKLKENLLAEMLDVCLASALACNPARNVFEVVNADSKKTAARISRIVTKNDRSASFKKGSRCHFLTLKNLAWWEHV